MKPIPICVMKWHHYISLQFTSSVLRILAYLQTLHTTVFRIIDFIEKLEHF